MSFDQVADERMTQRMKGQHDWKLIQMPSGEWYKAYYAGPEYGWIAENGNYLGDENPSSAKSTPIKIQDWCEEASL